MAMSFQSPKFALVLRKLLFFLKKKNQKKTRSQIIGNKDVREAAVSHVRMQINYLKIDPPDSCQ